MILLCEAVSSKGKPALLEYDSITGVFKLVGDKINKERILHRNLFNMTTDHIKDYAHQCGADVKHIEKFE